MVSLQELKSQKVKQEEEKLTKKKTNIKSSLDLNSEKLETTRNRKAKFEVAKKENDSKLEEIKRKRFAISSAFKGIIAQIKEEYQDVKSNPDSVFRDFFVKDKQGELTPKLNKNIRNLEDVDNNVKKMTENADQKRKIRTRSKKTEKILGTLSNLEKEIYPKSREYLKDKYLQSDIVSNVEKFFEAYKNKAFSYDTPVSPTKDSQMLVDNQPDNIEAVRNILEETIDAEIDKKKEKTGLKKVGDSISEVEDFINKREGIKKEIKDLQAQTEAFCKELLTIEDFRYYQDRSGNSELRRGVFSLTYNFSDALSIANSAISNSYNDNGSFVQKLDKLSECISIQKEFMDKILDLKKSDPEKVKVIFLHGVKDDCVSKGILTKKQMDTISNISKDNFYIKHNWPGEDFIKNHPELNYGNYNLKSIEGLKGFHSENIRKIEDERNLIKNYSLARFDENIANALIRKESGIDNTPDNIKNGIVKTKENINSSEGYLRYDLEPAERDLSQKLDQEICFSAEGISSNIKYPQFVSFIKELQESSKKIKQKESELLLVKEELKTLENTEKGFWESRSTYDGKISTKRGEVTKIDGELNSLKTNEHNRIYENDRSSEMEKIHKIFTSENNVVREQFFKNTNSGKGFILGDALNTIKNNYLEQINKLKTNLNPEIEGKIEEFVKLRKETSENFDQLRDFFLKK